MGVKVVVVGVKGSVKSLPLGRYLADLTSTGSVQERAEQMHAFLTEKLPKGVGVNFVAHSMGGLDCRHLISNIKPKTYTPLSLTTLGTPHRGSPFMDWCGANIGVGTAGAVATAAMAAGSAKIVSALPFSLKSPLLALPEGGEKPKEEGSISNFTSALSRYLLNVFDSPAYSNLTTSFLRDHFNPSTPDSPSVKYTSVAGRTFKMSVLHPLWFPKVVLDAAAEKGYAEDNGLSGKDYEGNDGLVSVSSAKWGEFLGAVDPCHHWDLRGEGGLFPNGGTTMTVHRPEGRPDQSAPGGWDWQGGLGRGVEEHLGLESASSGSQGKAKRAKEMDTERESGKAGSSSGSSWDIAQVGQVLDWVTDLLPGGASLESGKRQLAEAKREKEKEESGGQVGKDARKARSEREEKDRRKRDKFDLAKFYGGLMLKLREDGF